jgi:hypothetical protein
MIHGQRLRLITLLLIFFATSRFCFAGANKNFKGLTYAIQEIKIPRPDIETSQPEREAFETCYVFPQFVILQLDSGNMGADSISVRHTKKSDDPKKVCTSKSWPQELKLPLVDTEYFLGAQEGVLFTQSADLFGNQGTIWIYDVMNGKQLFKADYSTAQDFIVKFQDKAIALEFYKQLKLNCPLHESEKTCWQKILKDNGVPNAISISPPDCKDAYKRLDLNKNPSLSKLPDAVQIFAKVKIENVKKPEVNFLIAIPTCNHTP